MERIIKAFFNSLAGMKAAFATEEAFRQEVYLSIIIMPAIFIIEISLVEKVLVVMALSLVLVAELANTALEELSDRVTKEIDPAIKKVKDVASAAVLIALINLSVTLAIILL